MYGTRIQTQLLKHGVTIITTSHIIVRETVCTNLEVVQSIKEARFEHKVLVQKLIQKKVNVSDLRKRNKKTHCVALSH